MNENYLPSSGGAKIIKKANQRAASIAFGSVVKRQILDVEEKARSILLDARQEALDLIEAAAEEKGNGSVYTHVTAPISDARKTENRVL